MRDQLILDFQVYQSWSKFNCWFVLFMLPCIWCFTVWMCNDTSQTRGFLMCAVYYNFIVSMILHGCQVMGMGMNAYQTAAVTIPDFVLNLYFCSVAHRFRMMKL